MKDDLRLKDNFFIVKMILNTDKNYNYNIINENMIKKIINKNNDILHLFH